MLVGRSSSATTSIIAFKFGEDLIHGECCGRDKSEKANFHSYSQLMLNLSLNR